MAAIRTLKIKKYLRLGIRFGHAIYEPAYRLFRQLVRLDRLSIDSRVENAALYNQRPRRLNIFAIRGRGEVDAARRPKSDPEIIIDQFAGILFFTTSRFRRNPDVVGRYFELQLPPTTRTLGKSFKNRTECYFPEAKQGSVSLPDRQRRQLF